jgi:hypothetical protein
MASVLLILFFLDCSLWGTQILYCEQPFGEAHNKELRASVNSHVSALESGFPPLASVKLPMAMVLINSLTATSGENLSQNQPAKPSQIPDPYKPWEIVFYGAKFKNNLLHSNR